MHHYHSHHLDHHLILGRELKRREKGHVLAKLQLVNWLGLKVETVNNFSGWFALPTSFYYSPDEAELSFKMPRGHM